MLPFLFIFFLRKVKKTTCWVVLTQVGRVTGNKTFFLPIGSDDWSYITKLMVLPFDLGLIYMG